MSVAPASVPLELAELEALLRAAEPAARLLPPRLLRRVIKHDRKVVGLGLQVPHRKSYVIERSRLENIIGPAGVNPADLPTNTFLLFERPDPRRLASMPRGPALVKYWRMLFHARVHQELERRVVDGALTPAAIRERIDKIGQTEFDEIRAVLRAEKFLLPPGDSETAYIEFAALYLELRYFAEDLLPRYFPTLENHKQVDDLLALDLEGARLFAATRLAGAPHPEELPKTDPTPRHTADAHGSGPSSASEFARHSAEAAEASARGNSVGAAIRLMKAARAAEPDQVEPTREAALVELARLLPRLDQALPLSTADSANLAKVLPELLDHAADGVWPHEARLLYDLQKVCLEREKEVFALAPIRYLLSFGWKPLARPLPHQALLLTLKHLRSATRRLESIELGPAARRRLGGALRHALHHCEHEVLGRFRPILLDAFAEVGLTPRNYAEKIALQKVREELLDTIAEGGYLSMSQLRDVLSRNQIKLPDLAGVHEFIRGDRLLRLDRLLAERLEGVYRGGEIYLRGLQRFSAMSFGTAVGRFLTKFVAIPYGGAYIALEGLHHILILFGVMEDEKPPLPDEPDDDSPAGAEAKEPEGFHIASLQMVLSVGTFLLLLVHVPGFRDGVGRLLYWLYRGLRGLGIDLPAWFLHRPVVEAMFESRLFQSLSRFVLKPLFPGAAVAAVLHACHLSWESSLAGGGLVFAVLAFVMMSRFGRELEEMTGDWVARNWELLRRDVLPGIFRLVMDTFKNVLEAIDRWLYVIDEWLRFRSGDSRSSLVLKAAMQPFWLGIAYVMRFCITVLIEPQINPIKHFPVVTVSHKLLLPMVPHFGKLLALTMDKGLAYSTAFAIICSIPGFFGFLVWELKENWRLYEANRAPNLEPATIGHHGETMLRLLKPGFHSGTLPRLYFRLRRGARKAFRRGEGLVMERVEAGLHQVQESIQTLVQREFLALLHDRPDWGGGKLSVGVVRTGSNRILVQLLSARMSDEAVEIAFEEQSGWLVADFERVGWLKSLGPTDMALFRAALAGLYKLCGVNIVREQLDELFAGRAATFDVAAEGLVVWPGKNYETEAVYDLSNGALVTPHFTSASRDVSLPVIPLTRLLYSRQPVAWHDWVDYWEGTRTEPLVPETRLLPPQGIG